MIIDRYRTAQGEGCHEFRATVHWEDQRREPVDVFMAVSSGDAERVSLNPDAFRVPAAVVALHDGERRISGGGPICPVLADGLANAFGWLSRWSRRSARPPIIDLPLGCDHPDSGVGGVSAAFVSGGVDSLALLTANHKSHPPGDPLRISLAIVVVGIQRHRWKSAGDQTGQLEAARQQMAAVAAETGIEVVPVATNLRELHPESSFWQYEYQGAVLAGIAHLFARSVSNVSVASTWQISHLDIWGSHPLLDNNYASHSLSVWHALAHLGRFEKVEFIATHPSLLDQLNVCNSSAGGDSNCGTCEKCLRTMLALEALRVRDTCSAFPPRELNPKDLKRVRITDRGLEGEYVELLAPLRSAGRPDLAKAIRRSLWIGRLRRLTPDSVRRAGLRLMPPKVRRGLRGSF